MDYGSNPTKEQEKEGLGSFVKNMTEENKKQNKDMAQQKLTLQISATEQGSSIWQRSMAASYGAVLVLAMQGLRLPTVENRVTKQVANVTSDYHLAANAAAFDFDPSTLIHSTSNTSLTRSTAGRSTKNLRKKRNAGTGATASVYSDSGTRDLSEYCYSQIRRLDNRAVFDVGQIENFLLHRRADPHARGLVRAITHCDSVPVLEPVLRYSGKGIEEIPFAKTVGWQSNPNAILQILINDNALHVVRYIKQHRLLQGNFKVLNALSVQESSSRTNSWTALHWAVDRNDGALAIDLLDMGVNPFIQWSAHHELITHLTQNL